MADVLLLSGEMVQVPDDEMLTYLEQNRDKIKMRQFKARRQRTVDLVEADTTSK